MYVLYVSHSQLSQFILNPRLLESTFNPLPTPLHACYNVERSYRSESGSCHDMRMIRVVETSVLDAAYDGDMNELTAQCAVCAHDAFDANERKLFNSTPLHKSRSLIRTSSIRIG